MKRLAEKGKEAQGKGKGKEKGRGRRGGEGRGEKERRGKEEKGKRLVMAKVASLDDMGSGVRDLVFGPVALAIPKTFGKSSPLIKALNYL